MGLVVLIGYCFIIMAALAAGGLLIKGLGLIDNKDTNVALLWGIFIVCLPVGIIMLIETGQLFR